MNLKFINSVLYIGLYSFSQYVFTNFIYPIYSYEGYNLYINYGKMFTSIFVIIFISLILPSKIRKVSDFLLHIHFIFPILFMLVLYSAENFNSYYTLMTIFCFLIIVSLVKFKMPISDIAIFKINWRSLIKIFFLLSFIILGILIITHWQYFNLDITKVYMYRLQLREMERGILSYINHSIFPILLSFVFTYSLIYKKRFLMITVFLLFVLNFGFSSHRQYLFLPFLIFGMYLVVTSKFPVSKLIAGLIFLIIFALIIDSFWFEVWAKAIIINRFLFTPAQLNFYYYDFFSQNPKIFWTDSKWLLIGEIIDYPYSLPLPKVIGDTYFNNPETNANTSWIGSGYAHAGFLGMIIYAVIIGLILKYLDFKTKTLDRDFIVISFSPFIISLFLSSDLKTVFLSHGLLLYLIILSVLK
jgi:oligosaccharide repeat unit polymerase